MLRKHVLILCACLMLVCESAKVSLERPKKRRTSSFPLPIVDGNRLNAQDVTVIEFLEREPEDEQRQIDLLANFPRLEIINMSGFALHKFPLLQNLPSLDYIIAGNNFLTTILRDWFSELPVKLVYFTSNMITTIENGAFGENVTDVVLDCNLLSVFSPRWFKNPEDLESLNLRNNKITFLEEKLLNRFTSLRYLDLAYNEIVSIGNRALSGPVSLERFHLQSNNITELRPEMLSEYYSNITFLNIGLNRLTFLSEAFLNRLDVERILILGNPWQCPCLKKVEDWITNNNVSAELYKRDRLKWSNSNPVCIYALSFSDSCIEVVDQELYKSYATNLHIPEQTMCL